MADAADIASVRRATDEPSEQEYADTLLESMVDTYGVSGTVARIWNEKAGKFAAQVDVTEAGASHKFSDLSKNALAMAKRYQEMADAEATPAVPESGRIKIKKIERT